MDNHDLVMLILILVFGMVFRVARYSGMSFLGAAWRTAGILLVFALAVIGLATLI